MVSLDKGVCYEWTVPDSILRDILGVYEACYGDKGRYAVLWQAGK